MTKDDAIKRLHDDPIFKAALAATKSDKDKRFVQAFAEEFLMSISAAFDPIRAEIESDPDGFRKRLLESDDGLLSDGKPDPQAK